MELIKYENFTLQEKEVYNAMYTAKLQELDSKALFLLCKSEYIKCVAKLGYKPKDEQEIMFEVQLLMEETKSYKWLTENQLILIFNRAIKGEFSEGQVFYSIANFNQWVKKFYQEIQRVEMKAIEASRKEEINPIPSDDQLKQQCILTINSYVESVLKAKEKGKEYVFPFGGLHHLYDLASRFGIINLTKERKIELMNELSTNLPQEAKVEIAKGQAYKEFILSLADMDFRLDKNGEAI
ncbi:MAG: hypothetical protein RLZ95_975 [Bacteroidota bacterium]|jgi:hypothetical protein